MPEAIAVTVDCPLLVLNAGGQTQATITVRNRQESMAQCVLHVQGAPAGWVTTAPDHFTLFPLQTARSLLMVSAPADALRATYPLTIGLSMPNSGKAGQAVVELQVQGRSPDLFSSASRPDVVTETLKPSTTGTIVVPQTLQHVPPPAHAPSAHAPTPHPFIPPAPTGTRTIRVAGPHLQTARQIEIKAEPVPFEHGGRWHLVLENAGLVLDTFGFNVHGLDPEWVKIDQPEVSLSPGESGNALLTIAPPDGTLAGVYPFVLRVYSHVNINERTELALELRLQRFAAFKLDLPIKPINSTQSYSFLVTLMSDPHSNIDLPVDLTASDEGGLADYVLDPASLLLPARAHATTSVRVKPKSLVPPNEQRPIGIKLTATPSREQIEPQSGEAQFIQQGGDPVHAELNPQQLSAVLEGESTLSVTNPGKEETTLVFAGGDEESFLHISFDPPHVRIPPKGKEEVQVHVVAADYNETPEDKRVEFTITITREGDMMPSAQVQGRFICKSHPGVTLSLVPEQVSSPGHARFYVQATNNRPAPTRVLLHSHDEADALAFAFSPSELYLSPGAEASAAVSVYPKDKLMPGEQRRVHPFAIIGDVENQENPLSIQGSLAQTPSLSFIDYVVWALRWLFWGLKWAFAIIVVLLVLGILLAGIDYISTSNPELARTIDSILPLRFVQNFLNLLPFSSYARNIVSLLTLLSSYVQEFFK